jgi:hypothetical protein
VHGCQVDQSPWIELERISVLLRGNREAIFDTSRSTRNLQPVTTASSPARLAAGPGLPAPRPMAPEVRGPATSYCKSRAVSTLSSRRCRGCYCGTHSSVTSCNSGV